MNLLCLHGFLGSPKDFDFLKDRYNVYAPSLNELVTLNFENLKNKILSELPFQQYHILGYSFGARLGARLFYSGEKKGKLICLAGHLGLASAEEKQKRKQIELGFVKRIEELDENEFLEYWNEFDLFKYDEKLTRIQYENARLFFDNYSLSGQPYMQKELLPFRDSIHLFYGELDEKYKNYALSELSAYAPQIIKNCGHRLIHQHDIVKELLKEKI